MKIPPISLWIAILFSPVIYAEVAFSPKDCDDKKTIPPCTGTDQIHSWSKEFFEKCRKELDEYDVAIKKSPFDPEEICLSFPKLMEGAETCIPVEKYKQQISGGIAAFLILIILDVIGISIMLYSCFKSHPPPPPPPPSPSTQPVQSQPTVVILQTAGSAVASPPKDEEKG